MPRMYSSRKYCKVDSLVLLFLGNYFHTNGILRTMFKSQREHRRTFGFEPADFIESRGPLVGGDQQQPLALDLTNKRSLLYFRTYHIGIVYVHCTLAYRQVRK